MNKMTPQHIKDKIESYVELSGNTLEDKHRLTQGANFGYSLASQQTSELKAENERLKGLIEKAYDYAREHHFTRHPEKIWENFKKENNLSYE